MKSAEKPPKGMATKPAKVVSAACAVTKATKSKGKQCR